MKRVNCGKAQYIFWTTALSLAAISLVGWMRFQQALRHWYYLLELTLWPPPIYLAVSGGLIGVLYALGLIFHLTRQSFTAPFLRVTSAVLILWLWADRVFFSIRGSFSLLLAGTIFLTILLIGLDLFLVRNNIYCMKAGGHASEN